jgi:hypothetical protein
MALSTLAMSNSTPSIQSRLRHVAQGSPSPDSEINANFKAIIEKQKASIADLEKNLRDVKSSSREAEIDARDSVDNNIELGCKIKRLEYTVTIKQREISSLLNRLSDAELLSTETQSTLNESNDRARTSITMQSLGRSISLSVTNEHFHQWIAKTISVYSIRLLEFTASFRKEAEQSLRLNRQ